MLLLFLNLTMQNKDNYTTRFETKSDLDRETKAVELFCSTYNLVYKKLGSNDIDFKIYKRDGSFLFYLEVKGRLRTLEYCYPLPLSIRKLHKMMNTRENGVVVWACTDGIIFSRIEKLRGELRIGGRKPRDGSFNDIEFMSYFDKNDNFKQLRYE
mgnify:CR=1 FL=1